MQDMVEIEYAIKEFTAFLPRIYEDNTEAFNSRFHEKTGILRKNIFRNQEPLGLNIFYELRRE